MCHNQMHPLLFTDMCYACHSYTITNSLFLSHFVKCKCSSVKIEWLFFKANITDIGPDILESFENVALIQFLIALYVKHSDMMWEDDTRQLCHICRYKTAIIIRNCCKSASLQSTVWHRQIHYCLIVDYCWLLMNSW